jgi:hypothetical protein
MLRTLREAATEFLVMVEKGDPKQLVPFSSEQGLVSGHVSEPAIPLASIEEAIAEKRGIFCAFFDSTCIPRVSRPEPAQTGRERDIRVPRSYREEIMRASNRDVEVHLSNGTNGNLTVTLHIDGQPGPTILDFEFRFENGGWKLAGIPLFTLHFPSLK